MSQTRQNTVMVTETHQDLASTAIERSNLYGLLADVFHSEPTPELLDFICSEDFTQAAQDMGVDFGEDLYNQPQPETLEQLAIEYTRLFLGPGKHISPHESVQLKKSAHLLWGEETAVVKQFMLDAGFEAPEDGGIFPDHISIELMFMSWLTSNEAQAWADGDLEQASRSLDWQHGFVSRHLSKWVAEFCRKIREQADYPFYREFSEILRSFVSGEKKDIRDRSSSSKQ
jgi:putative dimethyl sulfoxide reductase chaperone